jgi:hypothetical protein
MNFYIPTDPAMVLPIVLVVLFVIGVFNSINKLFKDWAKAIDAAAKPLSITLKTDKTPLEVMEAAKAARRAKQRFQLLFVVGVWLAARWYWPVQVSEIEEVALGVFVNVFNVLATVVSDLAQQLLAFLSSIE